MAFVLSYHGRLTRYTYLLYDTMCFNMVVVNAMGFEPKPDPLYTHTQPCKVFRVTRFTVLPATPRNLCNTLAGISHSLHHIETHLPTLLGLATPVPSRREGRYGR